MGPGFDADDDNDDGAPEPLAPMGGPGDDDMMQHHAGMTSRRSIPHQ